MYTRYRISINKDIKNIVHIKKKKNCTYKNERFFLKNISIEINCSLIFFFCFCCIVEYKRVKFISRGCRGQFFAWNTCRYIWYLTGSSVTLLCQRNKRGRPSEQRRIVYPPYRRPPRSFPFTIPIKYVINDTVFG